MDLQTKCREYIASRTSTYKMRTQRYRAVYEKMVAGGFDTNDSLVDVGAGRCEFEGYLRDKGWQGDYTAIDGAIDGSDLNYWFPDGPSDWFVAIEVLEHVHDNARLMDTMEAWAEKGVIITTPNSLEVDVIGCDPTHVSVVAIWDLKIRSWEYDEVELFGKHNDSLIAWVFV